jgi:hypothetical protein
LDLNWRIQGAPLFYIYTTHADRKGWRSWGSNYIIYKGLAAAVGEKKRGSRAENIYIYIPTGTRGEKGGDGANYIYIRDSQVDAGSFDRENIYTRKAGRRIREIGG